VPDENASPAASDAIDSPGRVLAVDTSTRVQALALLDDERLLERRERRIRYNHGSSLLAAIDSILDAHSLSASDLDLIACGLGPGSFTGLRVGLACAKALGRAAAVPVVGVSSLRALAYGPLRACPGAPICAALDARRSEVYAGVWQLRADGVVEQLPERAIAPELLRDELLALADETGAPVRVVGDGLGRYRELLSHDTDGRLLGLIERSGAPAPDAVARLGRARFLDQGGGADPTTLEPNYIRPSDAEMSA
jgi:tRNA threonylcarbamoyladenosine biosynthesis protein TsaB